MFLIFVVSIVIGIVLVLTGYEPGRGYDPPERETCQHGPDGQMQCKEHDR
jgi:hypothetical protein